MTSNCCWTQIVLIQVNGDIPACMSEISVKRAKIMNQSTCFVVNDTFAELNQPDKKTLFWFQELGVRVFHQLQYVQARGVDCSRISVSPSMLREKWVTTMFYMQCSLACRSYSVTIVIQKGDFSKCSRNLWYHFSRMKLNLKFQSLTKTHWILFDVLLKYFSWFD